MSSVLLLTPMRVPEQLHVIMIFGMLLTIIIYRIPEHLLLAGTARQEDDNQRRASFQGAALLPRS